MDRLAALLGLLVDWVVGPKEIVLCEDEQFLDTQTLRATYGTLPEKLIITSKRVVYHVRYKRRWIPNHTRSMYVVVCHIADELKPHFNPRMFIPQTYPALCSPLFNRSSKPHTYAINAFLDQFFTTKVYR